MEEMDSITIINDNEFLIRKDNKVIIYNELNIYFCIAKGIQTREIANAHKHLIERLFKNSTQPFSLVIKKRQLNG